MFAYIAVPWAAFARSHLVKMKCFIVSPKQEQKSRFLDRSAIHCSGRRSPLVLCPPKDILEFFEWKGSLIEDNVFKMGRQSVLAGAGFWICLVSNRPLTKTRISGWVGKLPGGGPGAPSTLDDFQDRKDICKKMLLFVLIFFVMFDLFCFS